MHDIQYIHSVLILPFLFVKTKLDLFISCQQYKIKESRWCPMLIILQVPLLSSPSSLYWCPHYLDCLLSRPRDKTFCSNGKISFFHPQHLMVPSIWLCSSEKVIKRCWLVIVLQQVLLLLPWCSFCKHHHSSGNSPTWSAEQPTRAHSALTMAHSTQRSPPFLLCIFCSQEHSSPFGYSVEWISGIHAF